MMFWLASFIMTFYKNIQESFRNNVPLLMTIQGQEIYFIRFSVWSFCLLQHDVSVPRQYHTQSSHISSSASCAGLAAGVAKDAKYLDMVEKAIIPLVVECLGVWTSFTLSILYSIADCMTTRSGISCKVA